MITADEIVVLDRAKELYLATNPTGTLLWNALVEGATRDELVAGLTDAYDIDDEQAAADVDAYIEQLTELDLLESSG